MTSEPRLFVDAPLDPDVPPVLDRGQAHYLMSVMRRRVGDEILLFNGRDGEWRAAVAGAAKREVRLEILGQERPQAEEPGPALWFAPLKRARQDLLLEKGCELGVKRLCPVLMRRSVVEKLNLERQRKILIEAAEQCGRLTLPEIEPPVGLDAVIAAARTHPILWADEAAAHLPCGPASACPLTPSLSPQGRGRCSSPGRISPPPSPREGEGDGRRPASHSAPLITGAGYESTQPTTGAKRLPLPSGERDGVRGQPGLGNAVPLLDALKEKPDADLLIGPEGGFDPEERALLQGAPGIVPVSLGPRILRAETAALFALAVWQAACRDRSTSRKRPAG